MIPKLATLFVMVSSLTQIPWCDPVCAGEHWELAAIDKGVLVHGTATLADGVEGKSIVLDGHSLIELKDTANLNPTEKGFTISVWFNPYDLARGQQMIVGKNRYSKNQRQWGLLIEPNGRLQAYLHENGWKTIPCKTALSLGHWHHALLTVGAGKATLFLNGEKVGSVELRRKPIGTPAPITLGGIRDGGRSRQMFRGALDEARYESRSLNATEVAELYTPITAIHNIPEPPARFALWDNRETLPRAADIPELPNVEFRVIKKWDKAADGYTFLHGVGLAWHNGKLYASIGHNKGAENTVTEEAQYCVSEDGGKTWSPLKVIDDGKEKNLAVSHGVFLSHAGTLWAFHGAYFGHMDKIHTRAYSLNEATGEWSPHGAILRNGFWAMNQPVRMNNGNWIMPGGALGQYSNDKLFPAAVAISRGTDFTKWDLVNISVSNEIQRMWGESALLVDGSRVVNIARYGGDAYALAAASDDHGRTWSPSQISNLQMATSKPAAGVLSTGQRYLICTTARDNGGKRSPLTIAVSRPGKSQFSKVFVIRRSRNDGRPGESAKQLSLSYPYAIEYRDKLYIGYSNNGGRKGNLNSAELAIVPVKALSIVR